MNEETDNDRDDAVVLCKPETPTVRDHIIGECTRRGMPKEIAEIVVTRTEERLARTGDTKYVGVAALMAMPGHELHQTALDAIWEATKVSASTYINKNCKGVWYEKLFGYAHIRNNVGF